LPRALRLFLRCGPVVELHACDGLPPENADEPYMLLAEAIGLDGQYGKCADDPVARRNEWNAKI
jgi:hypothetical protein